MLTSCVQDPGISKGFVLRDRRPFLTSRYIFNAYGSRAIDSTLFCSRICAGSSSKATESNVVTTFDVAKPFRSGQAQPMYRNTGQSCRIAFSPVFWLPMEISVADTAPNMIMSSVWYSRHECETTIGSDTSPNYDPSTHPPPMTALALLLTRNR